MVQRLCRSKNPRGIAAQSRDARGTCCISGNVAASAVSARATSAHEALARDTGDRRKQSVHTAQTQFHTEDEQRRRLADDAGRGTRLVNAGVCAHNHGYMRRRALLLVLSIQAVGCGASQSSSDAGQPNDAGPEATFCAALLDDFCALNAGKGVTDSNCQSFVTVSGFFECGDSAQDFDGNATAGCLSALGNAVDGGTGSFLTLFEESGCRQALVGTAADGEACISTWDCANSAARPDIQCAQASALCAGTCSAGAIGEPCVLGGCDGGFCDPLSETCAAYLPTGAPCPAPRDSTACEPAVDYCGVGPDGGSVCRPRVADGGACASPSACVQGDVCTPKEGGSACAPGLGLGRTCVATDAGDPCLVGLLCAFGRCQCTESACQLSTAAIGQPCDGVTAVCTSGVCDTDGGAGVCLPLPVVGQPCRDAGAPCAFPLECVGGTCEGPPVSGSPCAAGDAGLPCREGDFCDATGTCQELVPLGSPCPTLPGRPVCLGGYCDGTGTCAPFLPIGAACTPALFECSGTRACAYPLPNDAGVHFNTVCVDASCQDSGLGPVCVDACAAVAAIPSSPRDPLQWPFASTSIWNMPIGSAAVYVQAGIQPTSTPLLHMDRDILILTPAAPATRVYRNAAAWNPALSRCGVQGPVLFTAPIPPDYLFVPASGQTPNAATAILMPDGHTLKQTQPLSRCSLDQPVTTGTVWPDEDLYGDGALGAHGGSWLSAIGGTLRVGELRPNQSPPRHALKVELDGLLYYYNDGVLADTFRWPAVVSDGKSALDGGYGGTNPSLKPGALLALPSSVSIQSLGLQTVPAQMLAWTLQNYGAYIVDNTGSVNRFTLCGETGPAGDFLTQFEQDWGFPMTPSSPSHPFNQDMLLIISKLAVVDNNGPSSIGGGGTPLQPLAPPLAP